jgi:hypothetical protein
VVTAQTRTDHQHLVALWNIIESVVEELGSSRSRYLGGSLGNGESDGTCTEMQCGPSRHDRRPGHSHRASHHQDRSGRPLVSRSGSAGNRNV